MLLCLTYFVPSFEIGTTDQRSHSSLVVLKKVERVREKMPKDGSQHVFQKGQTLWVKCMQLVRDYFEKPISNLTLSIRDRPIRPFKQKTIADGNVRMSLLSY
ncbi:hypothetical protein AVEN_8156-1 [Araneus ventricosus]|uniref:Uncharacterized protein n=1 Tax=Araneus ventricosus TaxID=182803 RepID=A0A4Y2AD51_ARAVE|nr:hypothetical protein AVEN_8156-1 [Araneus ventricosus]